MDFEAHIEYDETFPVKLLARSALFFSIVSDTIKLLFIKLFMVVLYHQFSQRFINVYKKN